MTDYQKLYKVHKDISKGHLKSLGFKIPKQMAYYDAWVYKDIIRLSIQINLENNSFDFEVTNEDHHCLYAPYYYYDCGRNLMLEEVVDNVDEVFQHLARNKVLWKGRKQKK